MILRIFGLSLLMSVAVEAKTEERNSYWNTRNSRRTAVTSPLRASSSILGLRLGAGGAFEGSAALGLSYEYFLHREFGVSGQLMHASYSKDMSVGPLQVETSSKAITIAALGTYHPAFIQVRDLDPYLALGLAHSFVSAKAVSKGRGDFEGMPGLPNVEVEGDSTFLVASLNGRYFIDRNFSAVASLGIGLSLFTIGVDYIF